MSLLDDFWQRSLVDVALPEPDAGKGGKALLLPPGYDDEVPDGYYQVRAPMHHHNLLVRGIIVDSDVRPRSSASDVKVYPGSSQAGQHHLDLRRPHRHNSPGRHGVLGTTAPLFDGTWSLPEAEVV